MKPTPATIVRVPLAVFLAATAAMLFAGHGSAHAQEAALEAEGADSGTSDIPAEDQSALIAPTEILSAESVKMHGTEAEPMSIDVDSVERGAVMSESRLGGIGELHFSFSEPAESLGQVQVSIDSQSCADSGFARHASASYSVSVTEGKLVLSFSPALPNERTYRFTLSDGGSLAEQAIEVRALAGDVNSDGKVNSTDRSTLVGVWTGVGNSPATDVNLDGRTDIRDRTRVVDAWTSGQNCAP